MPYYGGPVLTNIEVTTVYLGINVKQANGQIVLKDPRAEKGVTWLFECFVSHIVDSAYLDVIGQELSDPLAPKIDRGTWKGATFLVLPRTLDAVTGQVTDDDLDGVLRDAIAHGRLPQPNPNTHFMVVHSRDVINSTAFQAGWGAYHRTVKTAIGTEVSYSVYPDWKDTVLVTHELAESISDPGIGSPGWGEICDPCEQAANKTVVFHGVNVATFLSPLQNKCVGPLDDGQGVLGVDVQIHMKGARDCAGFIVEGTEISFTPTASKNGVPIVISKTEWLFDFPNAPYQSYVGPVLSFVAPVGNILVSVTVTDAATGCYSWSKEIRVNTISQQTAAQHNLICKLRQKLLNYDPFWRLRPQPPWDPSRNFLTNPLTLEEIRVTHEFAQYLLKFADAVENVPGIPERILPNNRRPDQERS